MFSATGRPPASLVVARLYNEQIFKWMLSEEILPIATMTMHADVHILGQTNMVSLEVRC